VIALWLCLIPIAFSYLMAIARPSNSSLVINSFEWLRDHGAARIASQVENFYYSLNAPSTGGAALRKLPLKSAVTAAVHPPDLTPVVTPALRGEGVWVPSETWSGASAPVQITQFRSDPNYPQMVAGVAWIDTARTRLGYYPGRLEPAVSLPSRGPTEVAAQSRSSLLATFNSAFKLSDSGGGLALGGQTYAPMKPGLATLIGYSNGRVDVAAWSGGPKAQSGVAFARQNLPLIVDGGRPNPNLSDGPEWGLTLGNAVRVWRSGIGVDRNGNLIYAGAPDQTVGSLAQILIRAGAVRAMQLDINSYWVTFITYGRPNAGSPSSLLPGMTRGPDRYLAPEDRDFFAVFVR
jgi:Phosphodiester glycosidase